MEDKPIECPGVPGAISRCWPHDVFKCHRQELEQVFAVGGAEVDRMSASAWKDPEDALMFESALSLKADAIITRNAKDF